MERHGRVVAAATALLLGVAFCFVMYAWQLRYPYAFHAPAGNLVIAIPFAGLAAMVVGGMSRTAAALGWVIFAGTTGWAYVAAATSPSSTAALAFLLPWLYGTFAVVIVFAFDSIIRARKALPTPMSLELRSARSFPPGERAELFNAAYSDYLVPVHVDEAALDVMAEAFDLDLDASRVAYRDGEPVGFGNLGVRGEDGWIGGVGVVPGARRSGVGEALMRAVHDEARARGLRGVWLEVIFENTGAFALYEKLGYGTVRDVEVWSLPLSVSETSGADHVPSAVAHARVRELRTSREPWQRADGTLAHYADARGLVTPAGAAVYRQPTDTVQLVQLAGEAEPLLLALRTLGPVSVLNLPADDPAADVLRALGATVAVRQHEMLLEL